MSESYKFVVSIQGDPTKVSHASWESPMQAEEEGRKWAEQQHSLKDKNYTVRSQLSGD